MHPDAAQLSSIESALTELTERVVAIADRHAGTASNEAVASSLYDVERNLLAASRRLETALRDLG
jgi:hypothetical protein